MRKLLVHTLMGAMALATPVMADTPLPEYDTVAMCHRTRTEPALIKQCIDYNNALLVGLRHDWPITSEGVKVVCVTAAQHHTPDTYADLYACVDAFSVHQYSPFTGQRQ